LGKENFMFCPVFQAIVRQKVVQRTILGGPGQIHKVQVGKVGAKRCGGT